MNENQPPPTPPTFREKLSLLTQNTELSDEQFEDQLNKILREKLEKELDDNQIFALRNCI